MIRRPPRSTQSRSSAASDVYKRQVLGLVTSKSGRLEPRDEIKRRIDEATKYVALDQLCLSPQCGFASTEEGNVLAEDEQWAKLRMICLLYTSDAADDLLCVDLGGR